MNNNYLCSFLPSLQSPLLVHSNTSKHSSRVSERYSGLWEFYYDQYRDDVTVVESEGGDGGRGEGQGSRLKNIRGFLLKRRKSPLKGWHKVSSQGKGGLFMNMATMTIISKCNSTLPPPSSPPSLVPLTSL